MIMTQHQVTEKVQFTAGADEALGAHFPNPIRIRRSSLPGYRVRRGILLVAMLAAFCGAAMAGDFVIPPAPTCPSNISYIPTWNILTDKGFLCFVGSDPVQPGTSLINTPVVPVILRFLNANGVAVGTSDPTKPLYVNPTKGADLSAWSAVLDSPIFQGYNFKLGSTSLGNMQWGQAVEEASFWKYPGVNFKDWLVMMTPFPFPPVTLDVPSGSWSAGFAPHSYLVDQKVLDGFVDKQMATIPTGMVPIFLTYNISEYPHGNTAGCCTWGWHNTSAARSGKGHRPSDARELEAVRSFKKTAHSVGRIRSVQSCGLRRGSNRRISVPQSNSHGTSRCGRSSYGAGSCTAGFTSAKMTAEWIRGVRCC